MTIAENPIGSIFADQDEHGERSREQRKRAYRSARRHSVLVRVLRLFLPLLGIAILVGIFVVSWISKPMRVDITIAGQTVSVNGIVMDSPTLTGFDSSNRRYRVSAETAVQAITSPDRIRLNDIEAEVTLPDQGTATITAGGGDYDNKARVLQLIGGIFVDSTLGYQVSLKNAEIDLRAGTLTSRNPVTIRYQDSEVTGDQLTVLDRGDLVVLEGRVETLIMPPKRSDEQGSNDEGQSAVDTSEQAPRSIEDLIERTE